MANRRFNQYMYSFYSKPVILTAKFTIAATNAAGCTGFALPGAGTFGGPNSSLTTFGTGIKQVYCYSSSAASDNYCASATFQIQLNDNYTTLYDMDFKTSANVTGSQILLSTGLTAGVMYRITALGSSSTANWVTAGLPVGITPAVGATFIASNSSAGTGSGGVKALTPSGITGIEIGGDPDYTLSPNPSQVAQGFNGGNGGYLYGSFIRTASLQQPADGTIVWIRLLLGSSTAVGG